MSSSVHQVAYALLQRSSSLSPAQPLPSTLIMHLQADPSPASHFLPLGYSATPPLPSSSRLLSLPQRLPTTHHHQPHPLTPSFCQPRIWRPRGATDSLPVASRSWAEREGPPAAAWNTHPSSQHPPSARQDGQERVYQEAVLKNSSPAKDGRET